jgi:hypothetical protein
MRVTLYDILAQMPLGMGDQDLSDCLEILAGEYDLDNYGRQTLRQMYESLED